MESSSNLRFRISPETKNPDEIRCYFSKCYDFIFTVCNNSKNHDVKDKLDNLCSHMQNLKVFSKEKTMTKSLISEMINEIETTINSLNSLINIINIYYERNILTSKLHITIQQKEKLNHLYLTMKIMYENISQNKHQIYSHAM